MAEVEKQATQVVGGETKFKLATEVESELIVLGVAKLPQRDEVMEVFKWLA